MKKCILVISFFIISVSGLWAQRTTVKLTRFTKEPTIIYTAKEVVLKFDKQSFLDVFASIENDTWINYYPRENKVATASVAWLVKQNKTVQLDENMTDQSKPEQALGWLVQNLVGAQLIIKGDAEIYELKGNKKKEVIEVIEEVSELSGRSYTFFDPAQSREFLKIWNVNKRQDFTIEIDEPTIEVVFEEPIEEVVTYDDASKIYTVTEIQPQYPDGYEKWAEYVKNSLKYPKDAIDQKIEGSVYVEFVVQETGKLTDFKIVRGISTSCDKEALRICKGSIDWKPAQQGGKSVKCRFVMPIKFRLSDLEKK
jgi:TonB family protein